MSTPCPEIPECPRATENLKDKLWPYGIAINESAERCAEGWRIYIEGLPCAHHLLVLQPHMGIETEGECATGKQCGGDSGEQAVSLPAHNPKKQSDGEGYEQVWLHGARQESHAGKEGVRLVQ